MVKKLEKKAQGVIRQEVMEGDRREEVLALGELIENLEELNRWQHKLLLEAKKRVEGLLKT